MKVDAHRAALGASESLANAIFHPLADLLRARVLDPPARPGLLACLDQYDIIRLIGVGAMGLVFLSHDPASGQRVAIKVLRPELATIPGIANRFLREARHMMRLSHRGILGVMTVSERCESPYIVLPYMPGGSLAELMQNGQPLERGLVLQISRELAEVLAYAHREGVIHRDVKPGNVLLAEDGSIRLGDFGLGRALVSNAAREMTSTTVEGTPQYMSPEVASGLPADARSDIYGLGAVMYELLTGRPPYDGPSPADILAKVRGTDPVPIRRVSPAADVHLSQIAAWAMGRQLANRYRTVADLLGDLHLAAENKPPRGPHGSDCP
ncbi:MAG: serine/threonine-protein kinase [Planctomycetota bacterium]|nr:serine/threonine-protein kinase [Planctomycetota bacterium]